MKFFVYKRILLHADCPLRLAAYCDSDWAGFLITRQFVTRYFISLGGSPISWKTKKQNNVSQSFDEDEYRSMAQLVSANSSGSTNCFAIFGCLFPRSIPLHYNSQTSIILLPIPFTTSRKNTLRLTVISCVMLFSLITFLHAMFEMRLSLPISSPKLFIHSILYHANCAFTIPMLQHEREY